MASVIRRSGLIVGGRVYDPGVPVRTWHDHGMEVRIGRGARRRRLDKYDLNKGVLHWTGGEGDARQLFRVLSRRELGVEFFTDVDGIIWQYADPWFVDTFDSGLLNRTSWGNEIQNYGWRRPKRLWSIPKKGRNRPTYRTMLHGRVRTFAAFTDKQISSTIALCECMREVLQMSRQVPKDINGDLITHAMSRRELKEFSGVLGHYHIKRAKMDPGTDLLNAMVDAGW